VATTAGEDPDQYKVRLFKAWGIGRKDEKDGLLLLVAQQERRAVFETGYGLEGTLPDGWEARMLREVLVPRFQAGETADGITFAVVAASERIAAEKGVVLQWTGDALRYGSARGRRGAGGGGILALVLLLAGLLGVPPWIIIVVGIIAFLVLSALMRRSGFSGGGYGGGPFIGGGWGGGFGGGGGGSSFGGFGGGSSGGGGGGASW
jgi:uncharacterized protein